MGENGRLDRIARVDEAQAVEQIGNHLRERFIAMALTLQHTIDTRYPRSGLGIVFRNWAEQTHTSAFERMFRSFPRQLQWTGPDIEVKLTDLQLTARKEHLDDDAE